MTVCELIGIPFADGQSGAAGCDCYGLLRLYYKEILGIDVPIFPVTSEQTKIIFQSFLGEISSHWQLVKKPNEHDGIAMAHHPNHPNIVQHFGVYIGRGKMLHTLQGIGSHVVRIDEYANVVKGFYRWRS